MIASRPTYDELMHRVAQLELRLGEQRVLSAALSDHSRDVHLVVRRDDGRILEANPAAARYGYSREELLSLSIRDLRAPETLAVLDEQMGAGDTTGALFETVHRGRDGTTFPVEVSSIGATIDGTRVLLGVVRDITAQKGSEAALRASEAFSVDVLDSIANQIAVIDERGVILAVNQAWRSFAEDNGAPALAARSVGMNYLQVLDNARAYPDDAGSGAAAVGLRAVLSQAISHFELEYPCHSPTAQRWFQMRVTRLQGPRRGAVVWHKDITADRHAAARLKESEERYRTLTAKLQVGVLIQGPSAEIILANARALELLGLTENELLGRTSFDPEWNVIDEDGAAFPGHAHPAPLALATGKPVHNVVMGVYRPVTGDRVWLLVNADPQLNPDGSIGQVVCTFANITSRREADEARRLSDAALRAVSQGVMISAPDLRLVWTNDAFTSISGYRRQDVLGRTPRFMQGPLSDPATIEAIRRALDAAAEFSGEIVNYRKDGTSFVNELTISPVRDEQGRLTHFVGVVRDVTEARRAEADRVSLAAQLTQAQKMESVGRLAGGVAHDFNNMLGVIIGVAEITMLDLDPSHPLRSNLQEIDDAARRSADLTRQLLTFARKQNVAPRVLDFNKTVARSIRMLERLIGEDIQLKWRPSEGLFQVYMDPSQVDQILANLSVNARDAITDVGTLTIATENCAIDAKFCAACPDAVPGEYVRLTVSDTGSGMSGDVAAHIFEPFFTTKGVGVGTGLGLATVYGAVRQNKGFITVSSEVGQGATFQIHLPRYLGHSEAGQPASPTTSSEPGHETILVVEDEPRILRLIIRALERQGYVVIAANGPAEALTLAAAHQGAIDLLLTDVVMPGMNGRDLANTLCALRPRLERLYMSGYSAGIIAESGVGGEPTRFISKPFALAALAKAVRDALDRRA